MGSNESSFGWRVLAVDLRGPCGDLELIPFIDYIVAVNGKRLVNGKKVLKKELAKSKIKRTVISLTVKNFLTSGERKIQVIPSEN